MTSPTAVPNDRIREQAERLAIGPVTLAALSMAFEESSASSAEVLVEVVRSIRPCSRTSPRPRRRCTSVRLPARRRWRQVRRGPRREGERGNPGAAGRRPPGIRPKRGSGLLRRLTAAGVEVCVVRATKPLASRSARSERAGRRVQNLRALRHIDHRKIAVVDGRIGWVGGAGIEDHFEDVPFPRPVRPGHGPGRPAAAARLRRRLPLARRRHPG